MHHRLTAGVLALLIALVLPASAFAQRHDILHSFINAYVSAPTVTALQSGSWSNPATWGGGLPGTGDKIRIPAGVTVTVDVRLVPKFDWIAVEGRLRFAPAAQTALTVHTLAVLMGGQLEIGTAAEPITGSAVLTLASQGRDFQHQIDPFELTLGLIVMGKATIHGAPKTAWVPVSPPQAGATRLRPLVAPRGWLAGDRLVLTASTWGQEEDLTFAGLDAAGDAMVSESVRNARIVPHPDLSVHLANLSRNVLIRSDPVDAGNVRRQAHTMFMSEAGPHDIRWAEFRDLGRTTISPVTDPRILADGTRDPSICPPYIPAENVRGRYSLHFHHVGDRTAPVRHHVQGVSIHVRKYSRLKFGFINHSSNVVVEDSVGYNIDGSTFMTEEGNEIGGFYRNIAVSSFGSNVDKELNPPIALQNTECRDLSLRRRQDMGHNGSGFWVHSAGVDTIGNVAAGHTNAGFDFWTIPLSHPTMTPEAPPFLRFEVKYLREGASWPSSMGDTAPLDWVPALFRDNVAYAAGFQRNGRKAGFALSHALHADKVPSLGKSLIDGFVAWNVMQGVDSEYTSATIWRNVWVVAGNRTGEAPTGIGLRRQAQFNSSEVYDSVVHGFATCIAVGDNGKTVNVQCLSAGSSLPAPPRFGDSTPPPPPIEICGDKIDNDGDGLVDEGCPVDCVVSAWSDWVATSEWSACIGGQQSRVEQRTRTVVTPAANGGQACPALVETRTAVQACVVPPPPPVDCVVSEWSAWSEWTPISATEEQRSRTRAVLVEPANGGAPCPSLVETETRPIVVLDTQPPYVDAAVLRRGNSHNYDVHILAADESGIAQIEVFVDGVRQAVLSYEGTIPLEVSTVVPVQIRESGSRVVRVAVKDGAAVANVGSKDVSVQR